MTRKGSERVGAAILSLILLASPAAAYEILDVYAGCSGGVEWTSDPTYAINVWNPATLADLLGLMAATSSVTDRIDNVGGTWIDFNLGLSYDSSGPDFGNGLSEVFFSEVPGAVGAAGYGPVEHDSSTCEILEGDVALTTWWWTLSDTGDFYWTYGTPADEGEDYYDAGSCVGGLGFGEGCGETYDNRAWIRPVILHELGHNLGFAHSDTSYSFMNYGTMPWSNRAEEKRIEPLADDREGLRAIYPGSASELDVAVLNTWVDYSETANDAAIQKLLCKPSAGSGWSSSKFDEYCGVDSKGDPGGTEVCPGDTVYTRYAMTNYGTSDVDITEELWFSTDETLDTSSGTDLQSGTAWTTTLSAQSSFRPGRSYPVPRGLSYNTQYNVIVMLDSGSDLTGEDSQQNNWIPLRGTIRTKSLIACANIGPIH